MQPLAPVAVAIPRLRSLANASAPRSRVGHTLESAANRSLDGPIAPRGDRPAGNMLLETDIDEAPVLVFRSQGKAAFLREARSYELQGSPLERARCDRPAFVERWDPELPATRIAPLRPTVRFDEANLADASIQAAHVRVALNEAKATRQHSVIGKLIERVMRCFNAS